MDLKKLSEPLRADQIEFRVQSINKGGYATILAYKDARADMQRLDDVCGPLNWKREHALNNNNCIVSIYNESTGQWVSKEDTGTASNTEAAKGLASDSFKRACFNWGIGRELYDYPVISIKLNSNEFTVEGNKAKQTWNLRIKEWRWNTSFESNKVASITVVDESGRLRFSWGDTSSKPASNGNPSKGDMWCAEVVGFLHSDDSESLLTIWDKTDNDFISQHWNKINSSDRAAIKAMIAKERQSNE